MPKKIELWDGYEVEINEELWDDFDFVCDMDKAAKSNNMPELVRMYFALAGGDDVYKTVKQHIIEEKGRFSIASLREIMNKIEATFPKATERA